MIYKIGSWDKCKKFKLSKPLKWVEETIDLLGICIPLENFDQLEDQNIATVIEKAHKICQLWKTRQMSILGKIEIVNALITSLFIYKLQVLPSLSS